MDRNKNLRQFEIDNYCDKVVQDREKLMDFCFINLNCLNSYLEMKKRLN